MEIVKYPNEVLTTKSPEYDILGHENDMIIANEMVEFIKPKSHCHGLAANQVGLAKRFFVMRDGLTKFRYVFNPVIIAHGRDLETKTEKCMSCDGIMARVPRWRIITVKYIDHAKKEVETTLTGFEARVFQHEFDHINGLLIMRTERDDA